MKSAPQCGSGKSCSPTVRPTRCYASTNRRSRQATYPAVCSKRATLLGNLIARNRKPQCGRNFTRHWMLSGHVRAWGRYHSRIIGSMDGEYGPLGRRHSGKGRAVPERPPVDPSPFLFRCAQPILRRIDHATRRWEGMAPRVLMGRAKRNALRNPIDSQSTCVRRAESRPSDRVRTALADERP
jgi:hypothetical protein